MKHQKAVVQLFDYFYNKEYKSSFKLDLSIANQKKMVDNFLKLLSAYYPNLEGIGSSFLIDYFAFSFFYYSQLKLKRKISLNWIVGKKMFQKFFEQKDGNKYYVNKWLEEKEIIIDDLKASLHEQEIQDKGLDPSEENEKMRFTGEARLWNCLTHTTLYNHRSINCIGCENKIPCKIILSKHYPRTFKKRGYQ